MEQSSLIFFRLTYYELLKFVVQKPFIRHIIGIIELNKNKYEL